MTITISPGKNSRRVFYDCKPILEEEGGGGGGSEHRGGWGADQAIFGVEAAPKWSHASFIAQSSQFDILINRFGQLQTASVDSSFWTVRKDFDGVDQTFLTKGFHSLLPLTTCCHQGCSSKRWCTGAQNDSYLRFFGEETLLWADILVSLSDFW